MVTGRWEIVHLSNKANTNRWPYHRLPDHVPWRIIVGMTYHIEIDDSTG